MKLLTSRVWGGLRLAVGLALLGLILSATGGWPTVARLWDAAWLLPASAALTLAGGATEAQRLRVLLRAQGMRLSFGQAYRLVAVGLFFSYCLPGGTGGDIMKLYYLASSRRDRVVELATVLLLDRVVALCSLLSVVVGLALCNWPLVQRQPLLLGLIAVALTTLVALLLGGVLSCSARVRASRLYGFLTARMPGHRYLKRTGDALYVFRDHKSAVLGAALWSTLGHAGLLLSLAAWGTVLVPKAPGIVTCLLAGLGLVANALPLTPGGLGVGETAFERLFKLVGFTGAAMLPLAWRISSLPLCLVGWVCYTAGVKARRLHPVQEIEAAPVASAAPAEGMYSAKAGATP
jgi:uncharacterized protein (TIRG00374 family)